MSMLRREIKYLISYAEYVVLSRRISGLLSRDAHSFNEDGYLISSVYFDDRSDSSFYEKVAGIANRKKYRLRYYNRSNDFIVMECKNKKGDRIEKESARIDEKTFYSLAEGDFDVLIDSASPLLREVYAKNKSVGLLPRLFCEYVREAYVHPLSETRVTFDKRLKCAPARGVSIENDPGGYFVFPDDSVILEIKYNDFIPRFISDALSTGRIPVSSSKYETSFEYLTTHFILKKGERS